MTVFMESSMSRPPTPRVFGVVLLITLALGMFGCDTLIGELDSVNIVSVNVTPATISESSTGMTDQFFTVTIQTAGFTEEIEGAEVRIQQNDRKGEPQNVSVQGDTIVLERIALSWFQGLGVGEYPISARVFSADEVESVEQLDVATITVTE